MDTPILTERIAPVNVNGAGTDRVRVGVAGATGFAGQELLRWMAGHPAARVTAAMSSSPDGPPRSLPALNRIWDGVVEPFSARQARRGRRRGVSGAAGRGGGHGGARRCSSGASASSISPARSAFATPPCGRSGIRPPGWAR